MVRRSTPLESAFQRKVLDYIKAHGGYAIKIHVSSYQTEGEPDVICCYKGRFCAFELKQGSKLSELQKIKLSLIRKSGGVAMEVRDISDIEAIFHTIDVELDSC